MDSLLEIQRGVLHTYDGKKHEVEGGAYISPEAYLTTHAELERLREGHRARNSNLAPALIVGAALLGLAAGFWLGRRSDEDE